ncbi:MAG: hypothetical protein JJ975_06310, partial [Bacteroidia bacterium]|nr:hypothetical protein [Bacteroidia bacterium]
MKRLSLVLILTLMYGVGLAQIPNVIPYQGHIADTSGDGFDGSFDFEFRILDASNTELWASGTVNLPVSNGNYSASLGETGQPALSRSIFDNNDLYLEISFNDGVNGKETLSPNVRILPVPWALRSTYADTASKTAGFGLGDSLVLRDQSGDVRFVMNPNRGEFKMLADDTTWLSMSTNSNVTVREDLPNGGYVSRYYEDGPNGERFLTTQIKLRKNGPVTFNREIAQEPTGGKAFYIQQEYTRYCTDKISQKEYFKAVYKYVRDTVEKGLTKKAGIYIFEEWWDCSTGKYIRSNYESPLTRATRWKEEQNAKTESYNNDKFEVTMTTSGKDTIKSTVNPKTGEIEHSKEWVRYVVGMEGGKTVATYHNDNTNKKSSTTVDPDKKTTTTENQDNYLWVPETQKQCFGVALGGGDTLRWYVDTSGFDYLGKIQAEEFEAPVFDAPVFKYEFDGSDRVVRRYDNDGSSTQTNTGKNGDMEHRIIPDEGRSVYDGYDRRLYDSRDLTYQVRLDTNRRKESTVTDKKSGKKIAHFYDANENQVVVESNGTRKKETHKSDSVITVTYEWMNDPSKYFTMTVDPKNGKSSTSNAQGRYNVTFGGGVFRSVYFDSLLKRGGGHEWDFTTGQHVITGVTSVGMQTGDFQTGYQVDPTNGIGWFGNVDTTKPNNPVAIGFGTNDSVISYVGGRLMHVQMPSSVFTTMYTWSTDTAGEEWNFMTGRKTTAGISSSNFLFNSGGMMALESNNPGLISMVCVDTGGRPLALEMLPAQGFMQLSAGKDPTTFAADFFQANQNLMVNDTIFTGKFLGVNGNVEIMGNLFVNGNISKGGGTFRIDHPQYPDTKYLYHSFIESPDMMNVYNGNVKTNEKGEAEVALPDYFEALNMEFRYQLTCIGEFA